LGSGSDALTVKQLSALSIAAWQDLLRDAWQCIHAYKLSPMFCQLMSTYTDPFTSSSLLASASLRSCLWIHT
jgi:hypothetical protein